MIKTRAVQVRLTRVQHEQLRLHCETRGFRTLADYMRYMALDHDFSTDRLVREIHQHLLGAEDRRQGRGPPGVS